MSSLPEPLITISPELPQRCPGVHGTRVPVQALFDYIEGGDLRSRTTPTSPETMH